jgi:hypothetical protein
MDAVKNFKSDTRTQQGTSSMHICCKYTCSGCTKQPIQDEIWLDKFSLAPLVSMGAENKEFGQTDELLATLYL